MSHMWLELYPMTHTVYFWWRTKKKVLFLFNFSVQDFKVLKLLNKWNRKHEKGDSLVPLNHFHFVKLIKFVVYTRFGLVWGVVCVCVDHSIQSTWNPSELTKSDFI